MPLEGNYEPGTWKWANDHVTRYEESGGTRGLTMNGMPVVVLWTRGRHSGAIRKGPVMKVQDGDRYAVVASKGGDPKHPEWYLNLVADPHVTLQDGPDVADYVARTVEGDERNRWWALAVEAYPPYEEYQAKTTRQIPVVVLDPA
jgi:deazaflavin-dependent oxidoreductase (nitroreductase family)